MTTTRRGGQTIHQDVVFAQHSHEWVLNRLARAPRRQQRLSLLLPGVADRVPTRNRLEVAGLSACSKVRHAKNRRARLSDFEVRE